MGSGGIRWDQEASDGIRGHQMGSGGIRWDQGASDGVGHKWFLCSNHRSGLTRYLIVTLNFFLVKLIVYLYGP